MEKVLHVRQLVVISLHLQGLQELADLHERCSAVDRGLVEH